MSPNYKPLEVAIIGGGIVGLTLALGLHKRGVQFTIYERAQALREIGAGIGFTPNAERAMIALDPCIHASFRKVAVPNKSDFLLYVDGSSNDCGRPNCLDKHIWLKIDVGEGGLEGCRRSDFLEELVKHIPPTSVKFGKHLISVEDFAENRKVILRFEDGSVENADVVLGCDGIKSRVRQTVFDKEHIKYQPTYTHRFAFRGLVPIAEAEPALGREKISNRLLYLGPGGHVVTFPVAGGTMMNVVANVTDPNPWAGEADGNFTAPALKSEAVQAFTAFGPTVRTILSLLPEELNKWALYDMYDHPLPCFAKGRVCLAGDAAHAASPHHGAGAGCGVEDALVIAELLATIDHGLGESEHGADRLQDALLVYNEVRYERAQWLVQSSRLVGEMYAGEVPGDGSDAKKLVSEYERRCHQIWDLNVEATVNSAVTKLKLCCI